MIVGRFSIIGVTIGILAAAAVTQVRTPRAGPTAREGVMISECGGAIRELVIHYVSGDDVALPVYQDFLRQLPGDVIVDVVCPDAEAFAELRARRLNDVRCQLHPIVTGHAMTVWSRDRWVALGPGDSSGATVLLAPRDEEGQESWPQRAGDAKVAFDIAGDAHGTVYARRTSIFFDGGDLLATDSGDVFVTPALVSKNLQRTVESRDELIATLHRLLGRRVILLDDAPDHHAGMYMMAAGDRTMLVGDPSLAKPFMSDTTPALPGGPDWSARTQEQFDAVARQVSAEGYRVVRIPTAVAPDTKTYLTYVNVITDHRDGKRIVYLPCYRGAAALNESAAKVWQSIGYEVRPVDCTSSYQHFGNLHCLVNVLRRG